MFLLLKLQVEKIYLPCSMMFEGGQASCRVWMLLISGSSLEADIARIFSCINYLIKEKVIFVHACNRDLLAEVKLQSERPVCLCCRGIFQSTWMKMFSCWPWESIGGAQLHCCLHQGSSRGQQWSRECTQASKTTSLGPQHLHSDCELWDAETVPHSEGWRGVCPEADRDRPLGFGTAKFKISVAFPCGSMVSS